MPPFTFSINDATPVTRPNSGVADAVFTISLSSASVEQTLFVDYTTVDGTAKAANGDYKTTSGELTFPYFESTLSQTISVPIPSNPVQTSPVQNFTVVLSIPASDQGQAGIGKGTGLGTIINPNAPIPGTVQFSSSTYQVGELAGSATVTVTHIPFQFDRRFVGQPSSVSFAITGGTAVAGVDYVPPTSHVLNFSPNQTSASFSITILVNPLSVSNKTIDLTLLDPTYATTIGTPSTAVLTIVNVNPLIVTNTNDSGLGSLRQAITTADTLPYAPEITFDIPGLGAHTITPGSPLPNITRPMTINATTQPGYDNINNLPLIELSGAGLAGLPDPTDGLIVTGGSTYIIGFVINRFSGSGIVLDGPGGNSVFENNLGTDLAGTHALGNSVDGLFINGSSNNNISLNVISGNGSVGLQILGGSATGNFIGSNYIGVDRSGKTAVPNALDGIYLFQAPRNSFQYNVISGNGSVGVQLQGTVSTGNDLINNLIGTDNSGTAAVPNGTDGIFLNGAPSNTIQNNVISGNAIDGLQIFGSTASGNVVSGNRIGTDLSGLNALGNGFDGIFLNGAPRNTIGSGNLISANGSVGIQILGQGAAGNTIINNVIGPDINGHVGTLGNGFGVFINGSPGYNSAKHPLNAQNRIAGNRIAQVFQSTTATTVPSTTTQSTSIASVHHKAKIKATAKHKSR